MRLTLFLLALPALAAVSYTGSGGTSATRATACPSGDCTAAVDCTANVGTQTDFETALSQTDSASLAAVTVTVPALCVIDFATIANASLHTRIYTRAHSGRLTITTAEAAKLPNSGTRITPAYKPLMPVFRMNSGSRATIALAGDSQPARSVTIRGIYFTVSPTATAATIFSRGPLLLGNSQSGATVASADYERTQVNVDSASGQPVLRVVDSSWASPGMIIGIGALTARNEVLTVSSVAAGTITFTTNLGFTHTSAQHDFVAEMLTSRENQLPEDIVVQHCIFDNPPRRTQIGRMISLHALTATIRDNHIEGGLWLNSDAQGITGHNGKGPFTIENNYIQAATENLFYGGVYPAQDWQSESALVRFNYLPHTFELEKNKEWTANTLVYKGRYVHTTAPFSSGTSRFVVAMNTGCTGATAPTWDTTTANVSTTVDGTPPASCMAGSTPVTWVYVGINAKPLTKNNFEIKAARYWILQYNVFDGMWYDGLYAGQETMINLKASNCGTASCNTCDTGDFATCYGARTSNISLLNNVLRNFQDGAIKLVGGVNGREAEFKEHIVKGNLLIRSTTGGTGTLNPLAVQLSNNTGVTTRGPCLPWAGSSGTFGYQFENNTLVGPSPYPATRIMDYVQSSASVPCPGPISMVGLNTFKGNVLPRASTGMNAGGLGEGSPMINPMLGCGGTCTSTQWDKNAVIGAKQTTYPGTSTLTNCLSNTAVCTENWTYAGNQTINGVTAAYPALMKGYTQGRYGITNTHAWGKRTSPEGQDLGADMAQLPLINNLSVTPIATQVSLRWSVTQPIADIPCVVEIHTSPSFNDGSYAGEMSNMGTYYRQDADDHDRFIRRGLWRAMTVGVFVPLAESTRYWYRLSCGGDLRTGTFVTLAALSGTTTLSYSFTAPATGTYALRTGFGYSRSTGLISNTVTDTGAVSCTVGVLCTVSATVNRGYRYFYQWNRGGTLGTVQDPYVVQ